MWADFGFRENPYSVTPLAANETGTHLLVGRGDELGSLSKSVASLDLHATVEGPTGSGKTSLTAVTRHLLDINTTDAARIFDSAVAIQIHEALETAEIERRVCFGIAQFFIRRVQQLKEAGLDVPDTSKVDSWLNLPVFRGGTAGAGGFQAGITHQATSSAGFDEAGFREQVLTWLSVCFPSPEVGGLVCSLDNLELLETSAAARRTLEHLRDSVLSWPGLRWILTSSSGMLRSVTMSPRLQGHIADPIVLSPLDDSTVPDVVKVRIDAYALGEDAYAPVEPEHFPMVFNAVNGNLRASLQMCQQLALRIHTGGSYPPRPRKAQMVVEFLDMEAERYMSGAGSMPVECWRLFDLLAESGGSLSLSDHTEYGFNTEEDLAAVVAQLGSSNLISRVAVFGKARHEGFELTSGGWLAARVRRRSDAAAASLSSLSSWEDDAGTTEGQTMSVELGYRAPQVCHIVDITYRQLDYWTRTDLIVPSLQQMHGAGSHRLYSFDDIVQLKVIKSLLDAGMSLRKIRSAVEILRHEMESGQPITDITLLSDGQTIYAAHTDGEVVDLFRRRRGVFGIAIGPVLEEVESAIHKLFPDVPEDD